MVPRKILFVCSANRCRSPMAEALFKRMLHLQGDEANNKFFVESCGLLDINESPPTKLTIEVMKEEGIDLGSHRSRPVTKEMLENCDIIFAMDGKNMDTIKNFLPSYFKKTHLLKKYVKGDLRKAKREDLIIADPTGKDIDAHRQLRLELKTVLYDLFRKWNIK